MFTFTDLLISRSHTSQADVSDHINSELENFGLDIAQILLALATIYMLAVYQKFTDKIAKRDDPFSNAMMLNIIIFIVVIQKYIVEGLLYYMLEDAEFFNQKLLVTFRQSFVAIEILFVQIPIRHNFSLDHVETS